MIGNRLKILRSKKGLTQKELAEGIISYSYISQIENNSKEIPVYALKDLSNKLGVSIDYLIGSDLEEEMTILEKEFIQIINLIDNCDFKDAELRMVTLKKGYAELFQSLRIILHLQFIEVFMKFKKKNYSEVERLIIPFLQKKTELNYYFQLILHRIIGGIEFSKSSYEQSIKSFKKALIISIENDYGEQLGKLNHYIGTCYALKKEYYKSLRFYDEALRYYQEQINISDQIKLYINLGNILAEINEKEEAIESYNNATKLLNYIPSQQLESKLKYNISLAFFELNKLEEALNGVQEAIILKGKIRDQKGLIRCKLLLCEIYITRNDIQAVNKELFLLITIIGDIKDISILAKYYNVRGDYYKLKGNKEEYEKSYLKSIDYYVQLKRSITVSRLYYNLAVNMNNSKYFQYAAEKKLEE